MTFMLTEELFDVFTNRSNDEGSLDAIHRNDILNILSRLLRTCYGNENNIPPDAIIAIRELVTGIHLHT